MKKIKVLQQDSNFIAAHKPHGIATYQESRGGNAMGCKEILEEQLTQRLWPVHRIDADTSGVVLFALNPKAASYFVRAFKEHQVEKDYLAWCVGETPPNGSITKALKKNKSEQTESARTDFERIKTKTINGEKFSLVRVYPYTGRFHQIRRHLESIGHPIVGDPLYGSPEKWRACFKSESEARLMLLAEQIAFLHPQSGKVIRIRTKEDFVLN